MQAVDVGKGGGAQIDFRIRRDVALPFRIVQDRTEVELSHRNRPRNGLLRRLEVGHDRACHLTGRRAHVHVDIEIIEGPVKFEVERRLQPHASERGHKPRHLRQRDLVRADFQVEDRCRQILLNGALNR